MVSFRRADSVIAKDKICAVVAASTAHAMLDQLDAALRARAGTIELRLDWLKDDREIRRFLRELAARVGRRTQNRSDSTLIATCRRRAGGGKYRGPGARQLVHLADALTAGCTLYDLEIESIRECPLELLEVLLGECCRLASAHFFDRPPHKLDRILRELAGTRSDAMKIAARCDSLADGLKLLRLARRKRNVVAIPMGEVALPLRILALREGSALSYAPVADATAPGQISLDQMKRLYRADQLNRRTRVYGVIGNPIAHSLSPPVQNAGFQARRVNAVYLPFLVTDLRDFLAAIGPLGIAGFSVTMPHKQAILRHLGGCDPLAAAIGAVNTVVVRGGGKLYGYNTDYVGVLRAVEPRIRLHGSRALILGAGGAARAAAFALAQAGSVVCICARRKNRASELAKAVNGQVIARNDVHREFFDVIVNATPVGMAPHIHESPLDARDLNCRLVFDTITRPRVTRLLQMAARRGIETVSGVEMFVAQATAQWEIWTGERAPVQVMRSAAVAALDARK